MATVKKRVVTHEEYCIGCRLCEIHCLVAHSKSKHILKAFKEEMVLSEVEPRIVVESAGSVSFGLPCRHCDDAACIEGCMTGALYRDPGSGVVLLNQEKCVGCFGCIMACPFGVIRADVKNHKIASKCDLCFDSGSEIPACVANCPNEALTLEECQEDLK